MLAGAAVWGLASCSDNDAPDFIPITNDAISFNVHVPRASRAATVPTQTGTISEFNVWAYVDGNPFMQNISVTGGQGNWKYSPVMYWPADEKAVNFYGISPKIDGGIAPNGTNYNINDFTNNGKVDLLYSVNIGEKRSGSNPAPVDVNFRHALSQIQIQLKREQFTEEQNRLKVEVAGVDLLQTYSVGSFNYPKETTSLNRPTEGSVGKWAAQKNPTDNVIYAGDAVTLADSPKAFNSTGYSFAIPQVLPIASHQADGYLGAFIRVKCAIYSEMSGVKLWPSQSTPGYDASSGMAYLYFALNADYLSVTQWEPGKAYNYTVTIGVPTGTGQIGFDVTVDSYNDFSQDL